MKKVRLVLNDKRKHWVGDGFYVASMFSYSSPDVKMSPFLLLDYAAPHEFPGDGKRRGVGAHPHKGFETVTIAYQGEVQHRDSSGGGGTIGAGDVQWMTAGSGLLHEEFHSESFAKSGGTFEMVQLWVNLPATFKSEPPRYQTLSKDAIPVVTHPAGDVKVRVISGTYLDHSGPAKTYIPIDIWDVNIAGSADFTLPVAAGYNSGMLVVNGIVTIGDKTLAAGELAVLDNEGTEVSIKSDGPAQLLYLAGEPIDEPVAGQGPFVMNTREEIAEAYEQFRAGKLGTLTVG